MARRPHRAGARRIMEGRAFASSSNLEIVAGTKGAATAGKDGGQLCLVGIEGEERLAQQDRRLGIDGIARLREAIDRYDRDRSLLLDRDLGHASAPASCAKACRPAPFRPSGS